MGNCTMSKDNFDPSITISRVHFKWLYVIGKGGFGKVWKVMHKKRKEIFAMKEM